MNADEARQLCMVIEFRLKRPDLTGDDFKKLADDCVELAAYCIGKIADAELGVAEGAS